MRKSNNIKRFERDVENAYHTELHAALTHIRAMFV